MTSYRSQQQKRSKANHASHWSVAQYFTSCSNRVNLESPAAAARLPSDYTPDSVLRGHFPPSGLRITMMAGRCSCRTACFSDNVCDVCGRPGSTADERATVSSRTTSADARSLFVIVVLSLVASNGVGTARAAGFPGAGSPCVFEGHLKTDRNWYGYLANVSFVTTARMTFEFTYPADRCCQTILFYTNEQTSIINARMNCWQKEYLLRPEDDQMLRLTPRFAWSGTTNRSLD
jgi:hypothetical protein